MGQNENEKIDYLNIHKNYLLCNICKQMLKEILSESEISKFFEID